MGVVLDRLGRHLHERLFQRGALGAQLVQYETVPGGQLTDLLGGGAVDLQRPVARLCDGVAALVEGVADLLLLRGAEPYETARVLMDEIGH